MIAHARQKQEEYQQILLAL